MWPDVTEMREFYSGSLGHVVRRIIRNQIKDIWPNVKSKNILALGYATPFIRQWRELAQRLVVIMPAAQGALSWSKKTPNVVTLADEFQLPLRDKSIDYLIVTHTLEFTPYVNEVLKECWRVLADGGRMIVIAPNRRSFWARAEKTPFGQGRPYTSSQLKSILRDNLFTPLSINYCLFVPPSRSRIFLATNRLWEKLGIKWFSNLSGVILCEAVKQIYKPILVEEVKWSEKLRVSRPAAVVNKI